MPADLTYNRSKIASVNSTPINITIFVAENPDSLADIGGTGTTGVLHAMFKGDADESTGADVTNLFELTATPSIELNTGIMRLTVIVTPKKGDGTDGTSASNVFTHTETADAWQSGAGRSRQA